MNKKLTSSLLKVLVLVVAVIAMVLSLPSSVIPNNINDVDVKPDSQETVSKEESNENKDILFNDSINKNQINSIALDDDLSSNDSQNNNLGNTNTNNNNDNNNNNNDNNDNGGGSQSDDQNHQLTDDDDGENAEGDLTGSTDDVTLKYFDVTLFNYSTNDINNATKRLEDTAVEKDFWEGIYFRSTNNLQNENMAYGYYGPKFDAENKADIENGKYLILNIRSNQFLTGDTDSIDGKINNIESTIWTFTKSGNGYHVQNERGQYLNVGDGKGNCKVSNTAQVISVIGFNSEDKVVQVGYNGKYLNQWGGGGSTSYGGHNAGDGGNKMYLIKLDYVKPEFDNNQNADIEAGHYYIFNERSKSYINGSSTSLAEAASLATATPWEFIKNSNGNYTIKDLNGNFFNIGSSNNNANTLVSSTSQEIFIKKYTGTGNDAANQADYAISFSNGNYYLNDYQGSDNTVFGSYNQVDKGNIFYLVKADVDEAGTVNYTPTFTDNAANIAEGEYYIYNVRQNKFIQGTSTAINEVASADNATLWTVRGNATNGYTFADGSGNYLNTGNGNGFNGCQVSSTSQTFKVTRFAGDGNSNQTIMIGKTVNGGNYYLSDYTGASSSQLGNWNETNDTGNAMYLKRVEKTVELDIVNYGTKNIPYGPWNYWTGGQTCFPEGENTRKIYAGYTFNSLVKNQLDANGDIQFNFPQGGIFDETDTSNKQVYTNVGLPFINNNGTMSFNAYEESARFVDGVASNKRLTWNNNPQQYIKDQWSSSIIQGGFFPFDNGGIESPLTNADKTYHFGMKAELSFYITPDGKSVVDGKDIRFDFAGDDDVWVFIDGKLVLDMGGIHDSVDGHLNFAQNTAVVNSTKSQYASGYFDANDGEPYGDDGTLLRTQTAPAGGAPAPMKLFNEGDETGILGQTLAEFSDMNMHTLTIYYLERGMSESNFELSFNLPVNDTVSVSKNITQKKDASGNLINLTDAEQAVVDNVDYTFVLYRDGQPLSNYPFRLLDKDLHLITTALTDANGEFTIKNTQIASFVDEIGTGDKSHTYYVKEKQLAGFETPTYAIIHRGAGEPIRKDGSAWITDSYTATGLDTYMDNVAFVYTNYLTYTNEITVRPNDDRYVLDFGLPVKLDVLKNDVYTGENVTVQLTDVTCLSNSNSEKGLFGTFEIVDNKIVYVLKSNLTKPEVLSYTIEVTDGTKTVTGVGFVYIMPATSIYYEENFAGLDGDSQLNGLKLQFKTNGSAWQIVENSALKDEFQEEGFVGDGTDSCYGSDKAYLNDNGDSNGTSYYVNTTNGAAGFSYQFTGTGTTIFARTSKDTGTIRVTVKDSTGNIVHQIIRDTSYKTEDENTVLYNIPVYTFIADNYGTYTVEVVIAKNINDKYRPEFYLDGIAVYNPLDMSYTNETEQYLVELTRSSYATDYEANNTVVTLRHKLITENISDDGTEWTGEEGFVIFTDSNGEILLGESSNDQGDDGAKVYVSDGPKEELYMIDGQNIAFALDGWDSSKQKVYLGIKAPMGGAKVIINGHEIEINNTKECYYDITNFVTLEQNKEGRYIPVIRIKAADGLISITNIRVTGQTEFAIIPDELI